MRGPITKHGIARTSEWQFLSKESKLTDEQTTIIFQLTSNVFYTNNNNNFFIFFVFFLKTKKG